MKISESKKILKIIAIWFAINTVLGLVLSVMISFNSTLPYWKILAVSEINSHIISFFSASAGYYFGHKFKNRSVLPAYILTLIGVYPLSLIGILICLFITSKIVIMYKNYIPGTLVLSLVLTAVITLIATVIERLLADKNELQVNLDNAIKSDKSKNRTNADKISVKEKDNYFTIDSEKIIYLSAHGKKTVIHTEKRDYEVSQLIKEIEAKLDSLNFIRVHKQFILNVNYILRIQYNSGGGYLAYLKDEDESTIPVGRTYISVLKEKMNI